MVAKLMTESRLQSNVEALLRKSEPQLRVLQQQLTLGKYRLDVVAFDEVRKRLVVVELKTCAHISSLSQLLIYRSALRKATGSKYPVDALLVTTYLDKEVVDVINELRLADEVRVKVCVGDDEYDFKHPHEAGDQAWYQFDPNASGKWQEQIAQWEGI